MLTAKALMVALVLAPLSETQRCAPRLVLDPAAVAAFRVPNGDIRTTITINVAGRTVTADLASKSIRKGAATIGEHRADAVAVVLQGKLQADNSLAEAGLSVQLKAPAVAEKAAAA